MKINKMAIGITLGLSLLPLLALAQLGQQVVPGPIITRPGDIVTLIRNILGWISGTVLVIALVMLLWSAILYLTAGGSEDRVKRAKNYLIYAIVGVVVAVLAYSIEPFIKNILGGNFY